MPGDPQSYASLLRLSGQANALSKGKFVHDRIIKTGLERNLFLGNVLLQMYGNCGALEDADALFLSMHLRDPFSWNFMVRTYAHNGHDDKALELLVKLQQEGVIPDKFILVSILSACTGQAALGEGQRIHSRILHSGLDSDVVVATALLNMYAKCGSLDEARKVFDKMCARDLVSWNTLIAAYSQHGEGKNALHVFDEMQQKGVTPDKITFVSLFYACASMLALPEGKRLHACALGGAYELDVVLVTSLVNMYGKCGSLEDARKTFDHFSERNSICWNAMITAYGQQGQVEVVLDLFQQMQQEAVMPSKATFVSTVDACASKSAIAEGRLIHACIVNSEFEADIVLATALLNMYGKGGGLEDASRLFNKMQKQNVISWNAMITACIYNGQGKEVFQLFDQMLLEGVMPNEVTFITILDSCVQQTLKGKWLHSYVVNNGFESDVMVGTALISMYAKCGSLDDVQKVFDKLPEWNEVTLMSILSAFAKLAALSEGRWIHGHIIGSPFQSNVKVGTALINMYSKCGSLEDARKTFDALPKEDLILWNVMILAYTLHGQSKNALEVFDQMLYKRVIPDEVTFVNVLSACNHAGLVSEGRHIFTLMYKNYGIKAKVDHYNCIVDLFGRLGRLDEAEALINNMPFTPNIVTWTTLLGACQKMVDVKRGEHAAKHVVELDPDDASPYVTLSNIYAAAGLEDDARKVMAEMRAINSNKFCVSRDTVYLRAQTAP